MKASIIYYIKRTIFMTRFTKLLPWFYRSTSDCFFSAESWSDTQALLLFSRSSLAHTWPGRC